MALLTNIKLTSLTTADKGKRLPDGSSLFGIVRASANDVVTVSFTYRYRYEGKIRDLRCGTWPEKSLKQIRQERDNAKSIVGEHKDPALLRSTAKLEAIEEQRRIKDGIKADAQRLTVARLFEHWKKQELSKRKHGDAEVTRAFEKDVIPVIGDRPAGSLRRGEIASLLDTVVQRGAPIVANHLLGDLRQMFGFAITRNFLDVDPTSHLKKADFGGKAKERDRALDELEIVSLKTSFTTARLPKSTEHAIWIMLSTCCRVGEISQAEWKDVDLTAGTWQIPALNSKNARALTVYLSPFAKVHFEALRKLNDNPDWVLPNIIGNNHISLKAISKQVNDRHRTVPLKNRSNATGTLKLKGGKWTPHDLRRTAATFMGDLGIRPDVIERCLNHIEPNSVRRIYQRQKLTDEQKQAWNKLGAKLSKLTK